MIQYTSKVTRIEATTISDDSCCTSSKIRYGQESGIVFVYFGRVVVVLVIKEPIPKASRSDAGALTIQLVKAIEEGHEVVTNGAEFANHVEHDLIEVECEEIVKIYIRVHELINTRLAIGCHGIKELKRSEISKSQILHVLQCDCSPVIGECMRYQYGQIINNDELENEGDPRVPAPIQEVERIRILHQRNRKEKRRFSNEQQHTRHRNIIRINERMRIWLRSFTLTNNSIIKPLLCFHSFLIRFSLTTICLIYKIIFLIVLLIT